MRNHKLIELQNSVEKRVGSPTKEVEIATTVKLNPLYIADRKDEIEFLHWTTTDINSILTRDINQIQIQIGNTKMQLELADTIELEKTFFIGIDELKLKLKVSNNLSKSDILINNIDTHECIVGRLSDLKYGDKTRDLEISESLL